MDESVHYIGSRISLISKKDIRYEGILYNINAKDSTVALQTVRSYGTENRPVDRKVFPSPSIFEYVIFNGADIKDLHVCEAAVQEFPDDPAIRSTSKPADSPGLNPSRKVNSPINAKGTLHQNKTTAARDTNTPKAKSDYSNAPSELSNTPSEYSKAPSEYSKAPSEYSKAPSEYSKAPSELSKAQDSQNAQSNYSNTQSNYSKAQGKSNTPSNCSNGNRNGQSEYANGNHKNAIPGMGGHLLMRKDRGGVMKESNVDSVFNFDEGLEGFDKEKELNMVEKSNKALSKNKSYVKSSFFDTISCDALDRLEGNRVRMKPSDERDLNTATFGAAGLNSNHRRFYHNRGRGRRNQKRH